jgi:hypothetical protein
MAGMGVSFLGLSATIASVVMSKPAIEAASCNAVRTTLVGSMIPCDTRFSNLPVCASKPSDKNRPPLRAGMSVEVDVDTGHQRGLPQVLTTLFGRAPRKS